MPRDNVTPFRRRPKPRPEPSNPLRSHRGKVLLVHALTLTAFAIYFLLTTPWTYIGLALGIAAVAIAASNRHEGMPWALTHHEQATRTIIIGAVAWTLGSLLAFIPGLGVATPWIHIIVALWVGLRALIGFVLAGLRRPVPNPRGFLI
ncbi:MAG: hypothetical protein AB7J28_01465 [Hyphomonadaceae bacterium]